MLIYFHNDKLQTVSRCFKRRSLTFKHLNTHTKKPNKMILTRLKEATSILKIIRKRKRKYGVPPYDKFIENLIEGKVAGKRERG